PGSQAILAHQTGGAAASHRQALLLQLTGHARTAVGSVGAGKGRAEMGQQHQVLPLSWAGRTASPGKVAALADTQNLAQARDGEVLFRRIDELESHRLPSLAKKAV